MGRKQKRQGQHVLLFFSACLVLLIIITGCRMIVESPVVPEIKDSPVESPPKRFAEPMEEGQIAELEKLESQLLDQAESFLQKGEYKNALNSVEQAMSYCEGRFSDRVVHLLSAVLVLPDNPRGDRNYAIHCPVMDQPHILIRYSPGKAQSQS